MGDIKLLLRDAVPLEDAEPDLAAIAGRAHRRRARRRTARRLGAVAAAVGLIAGAVTAGRSLLTDGREDGVATVPTDPHEGRRGRSSAEPSDASAFSRLLATRPWLESVGMLWPVEPPDFLRGPPEPGQVVIGTLTDVRPGTPTDSSFEVMCESGHGPDCGMPSTVVNLETVIRVELIAPGDAAGPDELVVPWVIGVGQADQARTAELAEPFEEVAPIGARVLVYLRPDYGEPYEWRPTEPSGIAIEDGDHVVVPRPGGEAPELDMSFDEYLAELDRASNAGRPPTGGG